jgi:superkiller protein 3
MTVSAQQYIEKVKIYLNSNQLGEAENELRQAYQLAPNDPNVLALIGAFMVRHKQYKRAIKPLRDALAGNPKLADALINLGIVLRETGQLDESEVILRKAMAGNARNPQALYELAHTLASKNQENEAMRLLMQVIRLQPQYTLAYLALAGIYRFSQRIEDAIKICHQGLTVNPDAYDVALFLKDLYWQKGDTPAAFELMNRICNRRGSSDDFLAFGRLAFAVKEYEISERAYRWSAALAPETWQPHLGLAELYDSINTPDKAEEEYKLALKLNRTAYEPHNSLAMFHVKHDRFDAAVKHLEYACKLAPYEPIPLFNYGLVLAKVGQLPEARQVLCIALEYAPEGELQDKIARVMDAVDNEMGLT